MCNSQPLHHHHRSARKYSTVLQKFINSNTEGIKGCFLSAMSLPPALFSISFSIETKSWQKQKSWKTKQFLPYSNNLADFNNVNKNSFQRIPPKKILPKNFSKKIPPKKSSKMIPQKFLRFWKYPIPYIALGGQKPFRACFRRNYGAFHIPYLRNHNPLLIIKRSWILTIHKSRLLKKKAHK